MYENEVNNASKYRILADFCKILDYQPLMQKSQFLRAKTPDYSDLNLPQTAFFIEKKHFILTKADFVTN